MADIDNCGPGLRIIQNGHPVSEKSQDNCAGPDVYDEDSIHKVCL